MNDHFKTILDTLITEGFQQLTDKNSEIKKPLDFRITPYSLNTKLSFKFDNLQHFIEFLKLSNGHTPAEQLATLNATFIELGLDPNQFFYVNFFEKGVPQEL
jgi:hypothetical protein